MRYSLLAVSALVCAAPATAQLAVEKASFPSRDGSTTLTGYVFKSGDAKAKAPAVVMMHGRSGAYISAANGTYDQTTLNARHKAWARLLAGAGYVVLMLDDYGSAGFPAGFKARQKRPEALDDVAARPLHAFGALRYLRSRPDVDPARIALLGWANGGTATLAALADDKPGDMKRLGFRAGVAIYPGCGRFRSRTYRAYAPLRIFIGTADKVSSPKFCDQVVDAARDAGSRITFTRFDGATHSYDFPLRSYQKLPANAEAKKSTEEGVLEFLADTLDHKRPR